MNTPHAPAGKRRTLASINIFSDLNDGDLVRMNGRISPLSCEPDRLLYAPGEPADLLFLLAHGRVHLYRLAPNGKKLIVARLQDGAFFGAMPAPAPTFYQTYAATATPCTLYVLDRAGAERLMHQKPEVALRIAGALVNRLRRLEQRLLAMAYQTIPTRLAALILRLAGEQGSDLVRGYTHRDLADMLGTYRETISETLDRFRAQGLVRTGRKEIHIIDHKRLEELANS